MRHHKSKRVFGREKNQRNALMKSLVRSLILHDKIKTTEAKAKELRSYVEKLVTKSMVESQANKRLILSRVGSKEVVEKLFATLAPKYKDRKGGYTRVSKLPRRGQDASKMAQIEFV